MMHLQILRIRAAAEHVNIDDNAMTQLAQIGATTSLRYDFMSVYIIQQLGRYAVQLLSPAMLMARVHARDIVTAEDINECRTMFLDAKTSAQYARKETKDEGADRTNTPMDTSMSA
jgi:RuvB-like protein 1 (pontin 52)